MEFTKIAVATGNKGKLREIREIFQGVELVSMEELGFQGEIEETGDSFRKNAKIKAEFIARKYNINPQLLASLNGLRARWRAGRIFRPIFGWRRGSEPQAAFKTA